MKLPPPFARLYTHLWRVETVDCRLYTAANCFNFSSKLGQASLLIIRFQFAVAFYFASVVLSFALSLTMTHTVRSLQDISVPLLLLPGQTPAELMTHCLQSFRVFLQYIAPLLEGFTFTSFIFLSLLC